MSISITILGEVMVELTGTGQSYCLNYAGDTFNTAVYLSRLGVAVRYVTALGESDPFSQGIIDVMQREAIDSRDVARVQGETPGLYIVRTDPHGEREFFYWRRNSPIRTLFMSDDRYDRAARVVSTGICYLSGISLAVIGAEGRSALLAALNALPNGNRPVALDLNYRPTLWADKTAATSAIAAMASFCHCISVSASEALAIFGPNYEERLLFWAAQGIEIVLRNDDFSLCILQQHGRQSFENDGIVSALDTTGAGDSFNAGYLASRWQKRPVAEAVRAAQTLAAAVVRVRGAILPLHQMPGLPDPECETESRPDCI